MHAFISWLSFFVTLVNSSQSMPCGSEIMFPESDTIWISRSKGQGYAKEPMDAHMSKPLLSITNHLWYYWRWAAIHCLRKFRMPD